MTEVKEVKISEVTASSFDWTVRNNWTGDKQGFLICLSIGDNIELVPIALKAADQHILSLQEIMQYPAPQLEEVVASINKQLASLLEPKMQNFTIDGKTFSAKANSYLAKQYQVAMVMDWDIVDVSSQNKSKVSVRYNIRVSLETLQVDKGVLEVFQTLKTVQRDQEVNYQTFVGLNENVMVTIEREDFIFVLEDPEFSVAEIAKGKLDATAEKRYHEVLIRQHEDIVKSLKAEYAFVEEGVLSNMTVPWLVCRVAQQYMWSKSNRNGYVGREEKIKELQLQIAALAEAEKKLEPNAQKYRKGQVVPLDVTGKGERLVKLLLAKLFLALEHKVLAQYYFRYDMPLNSSENARAKNHYASAIKFFKEILTINQPANASDVDSKGVKQIVVQPPVPEPILFNVYYAFGDLEKSLGNNSAAIGYYQAALTLLNSKEEGSLSKLQTTQYDYLWSYIKNSRGEMVHFVGYRPAPLLAAKEKKTDTTKLELEALKIDIQSVKAELESIIAILSGKEKQQPSIIRKRL